MDVIVGIIANLFSAVIGGGATWLYKFKKSRTPFTSVTGISPKDKTIIVVPERPLSEGAGTPYATHRNHVTFEDMLAANYMERVLSLAGVPDSKTAVRGVAQFQKNTENKQHNVILICSPKANDVTREVLETHPEMNANIQASFRQTKGYPERWMICFDGACYESPSYQQTKDLLDKNENPENGTLDDYALLARIQNPWNNRKKLLIVSGIRGIGTWGAARCLRERANELLRKSRGRDFACIAKITYEQYKLIRYEVTTNFAVLEPE